MEMVDARAERELRSVGLEMGAEKVVEARRRVRSRAGARGIILVDMSDSD